MFKIINTTGLNKGIVGLLHILLLLSSSILANYYFGSIGVWPIDTFAFFDSANFINKGFLPVRDYWTSNGFLVDFIQSVFFKVLGVNWSVYLLQSSIINFLFTYFTYKFLKNEGLNSNSSLFYSFFVSILAYPSIGAPFPDHHSLLLSIIGIYLLIFAIKNNRFIIWFSIPFILVLAFLCKQTPSAFFIIIISIYLFCFSIYKKDYYLFIPIILSSIITILIFVFFLFLNEINFQDFLIQYIFFPLTIGSERAESLSFYSFFYKLITELKFFLIAVLILIIQIIKDFNLNNKKFQSIFDSNFIFLLVVIVVIINQNLIKNQNIIFFLLPILFGLIQVKINKIHKFRNTLIFLVILLNIFISVKYHYRFNVDRKFIELENVDKSLSINSSAISSRLKGLKWITISSSNEIKNEAQLLKDSINFLQNNKDESLIISYYQFILTDIDHSFYPPNRWHTDDGVSYPLKTNKFYPLYKSFYKEKLAKYKIKKIFPLYPLNENDFNFVLDKDCIKTTKINKLLLKHDLLKCFENEQ